MPDTLAVRAPRPTSATPTISSSASNELTVLPARALAQAFSTSQIVSAQTDTGIMATNMLILAAADLSVRIVLPRAITICCHRMRAIRNLG